MKREKIIYFGIALLVAATLIQLKHKRKSAVDVQDSPSQMQTQSDETKSLSQLLKTQPQGGNQGSTSVGVNNDGVTEEQIAAEKKLQQLFGRDMTGKVAYSILRRAVAKKFRDPASVEEIKPLCQTQQDCPLPIRQFYADALGRIPLSAELANVKALMDEKMLQSDIPDGDKQNLLIKELTNPDFQGIQPTSGRDPNGQPFVGPESMYLVATVNRLIQSNAPPEVVINATLTAISNSQDKVGQTLAALSLIETYPTIQRTYLPQLNKLGLSTKMLNEAENSQ